MEKEIWKDVSGFEGIYQVSNLGGLKSFKQLSGGRILSNVNKKGGYFSIILRYRGKKRYVRMHILVAELFIGPRPSKRHYVHHKDYNKQNNRSTNLEYILPKDHSKLTAAENPKLTAGMINYNKFIRPKKVIQLSLSGENLNTLPNCMEASRETGVCYRNIYSVAAKEEYKPGLVRKQAGGFVWKFKSN